MATQDEFLEHYNTNLAVIDKEMTERYGMRYTEYRRYYAQAGRFEYEPEFPLYLMFEQTYHCNLCCPSCIHGLTEHKKRFDTNNAIMPREIFDRCIIEAEKYHCPSLAFMVNDEPLLLKDLYERVSFAKAHGFMDLFITTNGNLLDPDAIKRIIEAGITRILFSIDAVTDKTYEKVRPGGNFSVVLNNLQALLNYKKNNRLSLPAVRVSFVANKLNIHEKDLFIKTFAHQVDYLEIQPFSSYYNINKNLVPQNATCIKDFRCSEPWRKLIIRPNGDVLPCCTFYGYEIILGNCLQAPLKDIFCGTKCRQLRREFKEGIYHLSPCIACSGSFYSVRE